MRPNRVKIIASLLTEDPDIFMEVDANMNPSLNAAPIPTPESSRIEFERPKPKLNSTELGQEADEIVGDGPGDADEAVTDELKMEQEAELLAKQEQQQQLQPQVDQINNSLDTFGTNVVQGQSQMANAGNTFSGLDQEMMDLRAAIANLGKV